MMLSDMRLHSSSSLRCASIRKSVIAGGGVSRWQHSSARQADCCMISCGLSDTSTSSGDQPSTATISRRQLLSLPVILALHQGLGVAPALAASTALPRTDQPIEEGNVYLLNDEDVERLTLSERQILLLNKRIQTQNRTAEGFPAFIREGFDVKVIAPGYQVTPEGIIYKDYKEGSGPFPVEGQEVYFNYTGYNESGGQIDSSYRQNRPAQVQLGIGGLIPGFDLGLRTMKVGTQRRSVVPPALGPPVGPSTFFSAKQCEVFDVELLQIKSCKREQNMMFSNVVCT